MLRKLIALALIPLFFSFPHFQANAQASSWSEPMNLSRSGAAEQPRIVAAPSGAVQTFWWDRFDGLTTAYFNGNTWSVGTSAPLDIDAGEMPEFVLGSDGRIHAFWQKQLQSESELWHASMRLGDTNWTVIEKLAETILGFKVLPMEDGAVIAAYLRISQNWDAPAGIYVLRLEPGVYVWNAPIGLDTSAYYRLETAESAWLHLAANGEMLTVTWREPRSGGYRMKTSRNGGWTWEITQTLDTPGAEMEQPRTLYWGEEPIIAWQDESPSGCTMMQKGESGNWLTTLTGMNECSQSDSTWISDNRLFWLWGQGSEKVWLAAWEGLAWTQPLSLSFSFTDSTDNTTRNLQDLQMVQAGGSLYGVGSDGRGEVWYVKSELSSHQLLSAPRPDWGMTSRLSSPEMVAGEPALTVDTSGIFHLVWLEGAPSEVFERLYYAGIKGEAMGQPMVVKSAAAGEFLRQPDLLADSVGWLHLTWSGGTHGEILYSRVRVEEASDPGAWSPVQLISTTAGASPQLARDAAGRMYLLFVTPLNEGRGVYLVRSLDDGNTWMDPELVFDAQAAGWNNIGAATLSISPSLDGGQTVTLHAAWGEEALPGTLPAQGVWYARAVTSLVNLEVLSWSSPFKVSGEGAAWPRLIMTEGDVHLVFTVRTAGVWERHIPMSATTSDVSGWSTAAPAAGWEALESGDGWRFGMAVSGSATSAEGVMHLVGMPAAGQLAYSRWTRGRWSDLESYALPGWSAGNASWVDAACLASGERLGMSWISEDDNGLPAVFFASRIIPVLEIAPESTPLPVVEPEATPSLTPTDTVQLSPTPDLNQVPTMTISSNAPLILGGSLASLLLIGYALARQRKR